MKEPVDHIVRPQLPWRTQETAITECGYSIAKVKTITREEFLQRMKQLGERRMYLLTCMTCLDTARRWEAWRDNPVHQMSREIQWDQRNKSSLLQRELMAIGMLISRHKEEFFALMEEANLWHEIKQP
jgi:hypothetical protein